MVSRNEIMVITGNCIIVEFIKVIKYWDESKS